MDATQYRELSETILIFAASSGSAIDIAIYEYIRLYVPVVSIYIEIGSWKRILQAPNFIILVQCLRIGVALVPE